MSEPITPLAAASASIGAPAITAGALTIFGVAVGIRPELLFAGFCGAFAAISLLNTVPASGDTWQHMLKTSWRRVSVSVASAMCSAYCAPLVPLTLDTDAKLLGAAFVVGAGAQTVLAVLIQRVSGKKPDASE